MPRSDLKHPLPIRCVACGAPASAIVQRKTSSGFAASLCDKCTPTSDIRILEEL